MAEHIELREIPRGQFEKSIEEAAKALKKPDPGPGHQGPCEMFRPAAGGGLPQCRGKCDGKDPCRLLIIAREGSHSDVYNIGVFCTCMSEAEIDRIGDGCDHRATSPRIASARANSAGSMSRPLARAFSVT